MRFSSFCTLSILLVISCSGCNDSSPAPAKSSSAPPDKKSAPEANETKAPATEPRSADDPAAVAALKERFVRLVQDSAGITIKAYAEDFPVTDADLVHFAKLPSLIDLRLTGPEITDAGLKHLSGLTELQILGLTNTGIEG
ncbi:MAG TPA: hypothetical protein VLA12_10905, partial [Planctomycetaceae bacterium]|nr:hypothetical protein [Planctomycetaceae bacterium]